MAIRVKYRGQEYSADTPKEAIALAKKLQKHDHHRENQFREASSATTGWTEDKLLAVTQNIGVAQQKLLAVLLASPHGPVNNETIIKEMGLRSATVLAGIQSGLAKQLRLIRMDTRAVYLVEHSWVDGKRKRCLTLNEGFRLTAMKHDWPDYIQKQIKETK